MRSLSATLLAAQQSPSAAPYVKVEVLDMLAGVVRPSLSRLYTGTEEEYHHAATMPADGSLIRARVVSSTKALYVQRVPSPGPGSDFSLWTSLDSAGVNCSIALCSQGASVLLFFVDSLDGKTIYLRESSDSGATWGPRQTVLLPAVTSVNWLAAAFSASGTVALFYVSNEPRVYVIKRTGGQWGPLDWWTNTVATVTGLACTYSSDWNLAIAGTNSSGHYRLWTFIYGDGGEQAAGTWSSLQELALAQSGSGVEFHAPFLAQPDVTRLSYIEKYTGASASQRIHLINTLVGTTFAQGLWRDPIPFDLETARGLAIAHGGGALWLSFPPGVWQGSLAQAAVDLSEDVMALTSQESPEEGRAIIVLRNDDGRYGSPGTGAYAPLRQGSQVQVSPGYVTTMGREASSGSAYWISHWEHRSQDGQALFTLHVDNAWGLLGGWHARRQYSWAVGEKSVLEILTFLLARVGLTVDAPSPSTTLSTHKPEFTVHPGESGSTAVRRLLALVPDLLFFRGVKAQLKQVQVSDPADYAYGGTHPLVAGLYAQRAPRYTRVQVYGSTAAGMAESFLWAEVPLLGERLLQQHDLNLDTQQKIQDRCQRMVRRLQIEAASGELRAPPNCGLELYDVVEVTDPPAGLAAAKRRVVALVLEYRRSGEPRYLQRLTLGGL